MNILIISIYFLSGIIFILSLKAILQAKNKNVFTTLYAQFFILYIVGVFFCCFKIYQQFAPEDIIKTIQEFTQILFIIAAINLSYIVRIIWNINNGKKINSVSSITTVIFLLFIEFLIIGSSWTGLYFYEKSGDIVLSQYKDYLYAVANSRSSHISTLVSEYKNKILSDSTVNFGIINCLEEMEAGSGNCSKEQLSEIVRQRKESLVYSTYLIAILDQSGKVFFSTDDSLIGEDWSLKPTFINRTDNGYISNIFYDEKYNQQGIEVSHPILKDGIFLGVWVARERPDAIYDVLQNRTNLGDTGEAILIDTDGTILSPQRFTSEMFVKMDNANASGCKNDFDKYVIETPTSLIVDNHETTIVEYANKYGRSILGAHVAVGGPTKGVKWCVLVEIGKAEALSNFKKNLFEAMILSMIIIIGFICVFIFVFDFFFKKLFKNSSNQ